MRGSHWFIICIVSFLVLMFAIECRLPKKFVWTPTFSHYDKQPFGCAVFDSLLSASLPMRYSVSGKTFYQLEQEDTVSRRAILVVNNHLALTDVDVNALLKGAERGNKIMLVSNSFTGNLRDTLGFESSYSYFNPIVLRKYAASLLSKDSLYWVGDSTVYPRRIFRFYPQLCSSYFWQDSLSVKVLAEKSISSDEFRYDFGVKFDSLQVDTLCNVPVAMSCSWGKGEIILVSTPLLFTNYGVLDGKNAAYIFRLLSQMGEFPIIRTEGYLEEAAQVQMSPFRYFISQRPLRWALYLTMIAILLFMTFTVRRRQRVIPVIHEPENKSMEFTELIGTLYFQKKDHADLVHKKYIYFAEELRREIQVDVEDVADDERSFDRIAQKTGMSAEEQQRVFGAFERLSNAATQDGFGLGLSIVKQIVGMLGGTIRLESEKGEGSRFTVELPMNTADIGIEEQTAAESLAHIKRPYSVIVLDDNPMVLSMTKEMYAGIGVHCDTFTTIGDAMEAMRQHTYDLMITDMKMPEINGYEVLELLRSSSVSNSKEIPIVVATASGSCSEEELLENGFTACLFKPFSISELVAVSDKCLLTSTDKDELPDLSSLLAYGDKRAMLDRLITETEKDMQAVREIMERNDRKALDEWMHRQRSSWAVIRADKPLWNLYELLHQESECSEMELRKCVDAMLRMGTVIIELAQKERRLSDESICD